MTRDEMQEQMFAYRGSMGLTRAQMAYICDAPAELLAIIEDGIGWGYTQPRIAARIAGAYKLPREAMLLMTNPARHRDVGDPIPPTNSIRQMKRAMPRPSYGWCTHDSDGNAVELGSRMITKERAMRKLARERGTTLEAISVALGLPEESLEHSLATGYMRRSKVEKIAAILCCNVEDITMGAVPRPSKR